MSKYSSDKEKMHIETEGDVDYWRPGGGFETHVDHPRTVARRDAKAFADYLVEQGFSVVDEVDGDVEVNRP